MKNFFLSNQITQTHLRIILISYALLSLFITLLNPVNVFPQLFSLSINEGSLYELMHHIGVISYMAIIILFAPIGICLAVVGLFLKTKDNPTHSTISVFSYSLLLYSAVCTLCIFFDPTLFVKTFFIFEISLMAFIVNLLPYHIAFCFILLLSRQNQKDKLKKFAIVSLLLFSTITGCKAIAAGYVSLIFERSNKASEVTYKKFLIDYNGIGYKLVTLEKSKDDMFAFGSLKNLPVNVLLGKLNEQTTYNLADNYYSQLSDMPPSFIESNLSFIFGNTDLSENRSLYTKYATNDRLLIDIYKTKGPIAAEQYMTKHPTDSPLQMALRGVKYNQKTTKT